jgi:hypothetical protein
MLLLTAKHIVADFMLQTSWMAIGKDQKTGWALPLLAHCLVHLAVAMTLILIIAPRFWFVALVDFAIHITILRIDIWRDAGKSASMVLDADRRRPGAASPYRLRPVDFHGVEQLSLPAPRLASLIDTPKWCFPLTGSIRVQPGLSPDRASLRPHIRC